MLRFIFDLDGTITTAETLPVIAGYFHMEKDMKGLTDAAVAGGIPFIESFIKRVHIMAKLPDVTIIACVLFVRLQFG